MHINRFSKLIKGSETYLPRHSSLFKSPDYNNLEDKIKSGIILIRHARSESNEILEKITRDPSHLTVDDIRNQMFKLHQIDSPLSEMGVSESIEASKHAAKIKFKTVWISPMKRCLQTALYIFRDHPNFLNIRF